MENFDKNETETDQAKIVLLKYLASGGFGDVYEGTYNGTKVAIKKFKCRTKEDTSKIHAACSKEASMLRELNHENVLRYINFLQRNDQHGVMEIMLITELIDGESEDRSLRRFCKPDQPKILCFEIKMRIATLCWNGLVYLHEKGVCHKDIKPENILVSIDCSSIKIADFGLSELKSKDASTSTNGDNLTIFYAPPEIYSVGRCVRHTKKSDVYSMGATLCELFSGRHFWANNDGTRMEHFSVIFILGTNREAVKMKTNTTAPSCWLHLPNNISDILKHAVAVDYNERKSASDIHNMFVDLTIKLKLVNTDHVYVTPLKEYHHYAYAAALYEGGDGFSNHFTSGSPRKPLFQIRLPAVTETDVASCSMWKESKVLPTDRHTFHIINT